MLFEFFVLFASIILFIIFSSFLVKYGAKLAGVFKLSAFSLSFILMAFATSIPEIFVGLIASLNNMGEIAIGVVLGSSIINLTLITGLIAIFTRKLEVKNVYTRRQGLLLGFMAAFTIATLLDGKLNVFDGIILVISYLIYLYELWFSQAKEKDVRIRIDFNKVLPVAIIVLTSVFALMFLSEVMITSTYTISRMLGIFPIVGAALLISSVTAIPELIYEFVAIRGEDKRMALGDLIGAVGTNLSLVVALVAFINPLSFVVTPVIAVMLFFLAISVFLFIFFLYTKESLEWWEGMILITVFVAFLLMIFLSSYATV